MHGIPTIYLGFSPYSRDSYCMHETPTVFTGLPLYAWDSHHIPRILTVFPGFPPYAWDSNRIPGIPTVCMGYPPYAWDSHRIPGIPTVCMRLPPYSRDSHCIAGIPTVVPGFLLHSQRFWILWIRLFPWLFRLNKLLETKNNGTLRKKKKTNSERTAISKYKIQNTAPVKTIKDKISVRNSNINKTDHSSSDDRLF
jgi:hypothetical protein